MVFCMVFPITFWDYKNLPSGVWDQRQFWWSRRCNRIFVVWVVWSYPPFKSCNESADVGKGITFNSFCSDIQRSSFDCIFNQLSGEELVAFAIRIAISGLNEDFSFISSERAFLDEQAYVLNSYESPNDNPGNDMSWTVMDTSRRSRIRANFLTWSGWAPFLLPVMKNFSRPLCLKDFIIWKIVTCNVTGGKSEKLYSQMRYNLYYPNFIRLSVLSLYL